jgi:hypothetical protein|tara:strand:+ start:4647 stop:5024 length:378 start_codon:yes stop_codon:yes gene_type:complete
MDITEIKLTLPKPPSLNMIYAGKHWTYRKKKKDEYKIICQAELSKHDKFNCESIRMVIRYNSRLDIDNGILVSKFLADTLVDEGIIPDDNKNYYTEVKITYDGDLPKNTYEVILMCTNLNYYEQT